MTGTFLKVDEVKVFRMGKLDKVNVFASWDVSCESLP